MAGLTKDMKQTRIPASLARDLDTMRMQAGLSITEVAKALGVSQPSMSRKFNGDQVWLAHEVWGFCRLVGALQQRQATAQELRPRLTAVEALLHHLPDEDERDAARVVYWIVTGRQHKLKPGGAEALSTLKALL